MTFNWHSMKASWRVKELCSFYGFIDDCHASSIIYFDHRLYILSKNDDKHLQECLWDKKDLASFTCLLFKVSVLLPLEVATALSTS